MFSKCVNRLSQLVAMIVTNYFTTDLLHKIYIDECHSGICSRKLIHSIGCHRFTFSANVFYAPFLMLNLRWAVIDTKRS